MDLKLFRNIVLFVLLTTISFEVVPTVQAQRNEDLPKLDIVILVDESNSMLYTDPDNLRLTAFELLVDTLGKYDRDDDDVRISVIAFGTAPEVVIPFTAVHFNTVNDIKARYRAFHEQITTVNEDGETSLGWTDILKALEKTEEILTDPQAGHRPSHKPAIIIFSDGKPETETINEEVEDADTKIDNYIDDIFVQADTFQGNRFDYEGTCEPLKEGVVPIYTIAVSKAAAMDKKYRDIWRRLAEQNGGQFLEAEEPGRQLQLTELGEAYLDYVQDLNCRSSNTEELVSPSENFYKVNNLYTSIEFTILKSTPTVKASIYRPSSDIPISHDGQDIIGNRSNQDEVWTIYRSEPWEGEWRVKLEGQGTVLFSYVKNTDVFKIEEIGLDHFAKACNPFEVALKITDSDGGPITNKVEKFELDIIIPRDSNQTFRIAPQDDIFRHTVDNTCNEGRYELKGIFHITDLDENKTIEWPWQGAVTVRLDPYLEIISPGDNSTYYTSEDIDIEVDVRLGGKLNDVAAQSAKNVEAKIYQNDAEIANYPLGHAPDRGNARLRTKIPASLLEAGEYSLEFSGSLAKDSEINSPPISFTVVQRDKPNVIPNTPTPVPTSPPPTSTPTPLASPVSPESMLILLAGLIIAGLLAGAGFYYSQMPTMPLITLRGPADRYIKGNLGGKFATTQAFIANGDTVRLKFQPAKNDIGQNNAQVVLLDDSDQVELDHLPLYKGTPMELTDGAQLKIGNDSYNVSV